MINLNCIKKNNIRYYSDVNIYSVEFLSAAFSSTMKMSELLNSFDRKNYSNKKDISIFVKFALSNFSWEKIDCARELIDYILKFDASDLLKINISESISEFDSLLASVIKCIQSGSVEVVHLLPVEHSNSNIKCLFGIFGKIHGIKIVVEYFRKIDKDNNEFGVSHERRLELTKHYCSWLNSLSKEEMLFAIDSMSQLDLK